MRGSNLKIAAGVGFVLTALMWLPYLLALELVLGFDLSQYKILVLTPFVLALIPVLAPTRWLPSAALLIASAVAAAIASQTPAYAHNHPRGMNITYLDDRSVTPRWFVGWLGSVDEAYLKANGFPAADAPYRQFGLVDAQGRFKPAADLQLAPPTFTLTSVEPAGASKIVKGTIHGGRGGLQLAFALAPDSGVRTIKVGGQLVADEKRMISKDPVVVRIAGVGERGAEIELTADAAANPVLTLIERSSLPDDSAEARALQAARPKDSAPVHGGDSATVVVTLKDWIAPKP
jgi:hypothetical protein